MRATRWGYGRIVLAAAVVLATPAACDDAPEDAAATPVPSGTIFLEDRERANVEEAYEALSAAIAADDWAAAWSLQTDDSAEYFQEVHRAAARAGPKELREADAYTFLAATVLRAAVGEDVAEMSDEEVFAALVEHELLGNNGELALELPRIDVLGDRARALLPQVGSDTGAAWEIDFEQEEDGWRVDAADIARIAGDLVEDAARHADVPIEDAVLRNAQALVDEPISRAVWQKP